MKIQNERREKAAPLVTELRALAKQEESLWQWLLANTKHQRFEEGARRLHATRQRMNQLQRRIDNIHAGRNPYGEELPTPTPKEVK